MTASEPPAKWGADSRGDDDVRHGVQTGGGQGRRSPQEEKRKQQSEQIDKGDITRQVPEHQSTASNRKHI